MAGNRCHNAAGCIEQCGRTHRSRRPCTDNFRRTSNADDARHQHPSAELRCSSTGCVLNGCATLRNPFCPIPLGVCIAQMRRQRREHGAPAAGRRQWPGASRCYYELAQVLLAMSAQVEYRGQKNDCTPLMEAASAGHTDIIHLLINTSTAAGNSSSSSSSNNNSYTAAVAAVATTTNLLNQFAAMNVAPLPNISPSPSIGSASGGGSATPVAAAPLNFSSSSSGSSNQSPPQASHAAPASTHLSAPSEVSQNTAISDRPKAKPVSKKDGKNSRKAAVSAATAAAVAVANSVTAQTMAFQAAQEQQPLQQQLQQQQQSAGAVGGAQPTLQPIPKILAGTKLRGQVFPPHNHMNVSTSANLALPTTPVSTDPDEQHPRINDKYMQIVAPFPITALQKIAQRILSSDDGTSQQPKSPADTPPNINQNALVTAGGEQPGQTQLGAVSLYRCDDAQEDTFVQHQITYEWEDAEEMNVIDVLQGDCTVTLQDIAANCHEFSDYANLIGINTHAQQQQQAKFVFNVDSDMAAPSLQLLFQLSPGSAAASACNSATQTGVAAGAVGGGAVRRQNYAAPD